LSSLFLIFFNSVGRRTILFEKVLYSK
jgi:hypothetical protein